ncbi:MAG: bacillithiol biosynthesis cysteine-adding enzyme BshC [Terriglobales bacterium]
MIAYFARRENEPYATFGEAPVKSQCLPFSQIPHTTKLFTDFLSYPEKVQQFYPRSPRFSDWFEQAASDLAYDAGRRKRVCSILERQNTSWNASSKTFENIARMRSGAAAVVTGQQVGLFGGPLFSLFKALTAVKLADEASARGVNCVPVFWLATEDHDLEEVNHVFVPGPDHSLQNVIAPPKGLLHSPVGTIEFGSEVEAVVKQVEELLGESEITGMLREAYRAGETLGTAFARLFSSLFSRWGVILLDAADPELHQIAEPIYGEAAEQAAEINGLLQARGKALEAAGYDQQVKVTSSSTLLFALVKGDRIPVHRHTTSDVDESAFLIGEERLTKTELRNRIHTRPQDFSPNVLFRPVVQDYLLPTIAYAGGAAEIAYFAQAADVYKTLLGKVTPVVPRFSATIVDAKPQALLERYRLRFTDIFQAPEQLRQFLGAETLPQGLNKAFEDAESAVQKSISSIREGLESLDKTLLESASTAESKILYQLTGLHSKAARAELRHSEILGRHAEILCNALYPHRTLQEREVAGVYFLAHHGTGLLQDLYDAIHLECLDHQIITLN